MKKPILCSFLTAIMILLFCSCQQEVKPDSWQQDEASGKWGYVSHTGEVLVPYMYDSMHNVGRDEFVAVSLDGKWGLLDINKKAEVLPCTYDFIAEYDMYRNLLVNIGGDKADGKVAGGKWGLINKEGVEIVPCIYDTVISGPSYLAVRLGEETGTMSSSGEFIHPLAKHVHTQYAGESKSGNETRKVSFVLETTNDTGRVIRNFSFEVEKKLGAGERAMDRTQTFSVNTSQELRLPANGVYNDEKIKVALKPDGADCAIVNEGTEYTCTARVKQ